MDWSPATEPFIYDQIRVDEAQMSADELRIWKCVAITPVKWALKPRGDLTGDFWVVAICGRSVIWYNDIEDGFDISPYSSFGEIDVYYAGQYELRHVMQQIIERISD
ncbi:hypothetical protein [Bosea sp. CS1GBMeth4]|uniref:hypothetical protein n=1 Tax=Bosea sp. CS1GBMeth4 TaxID=1892849 RepID=UPI001646942B|nr:hypothetical protein [Bosea sp. CS1GBMeth4]